MRVIDKIDNRTHIPPGQLKEKPPFPTDMKIEITARCNLACKNCGYTKKLRKIGDMPVHVYQGIIEQAKKAGVNELGVFLLGESFILHNLSHYIAVAKEVGIEYVYLTTNGTLCDPLSLQAVFDAGLDSIKFSLNAGGPVKYKEQTGYDMFAKVLDNIRWACENKGKVNVSVSCIYDEAQRVEMEAIKEKVNSWGGEYYYLPNLNHGGHVKGKYYGNIGRLENSVPPVPCWELFNTSRVTWDGWLTMCCFDHTGKFKVADLTTTKLIDAWHDKKFVNLRRAHLQDKIKGTLCDHCLTHECDNID